MNPIRVEICVGTACHLFGSEELLAMIEALPESQRDQFEIKGVRCLGACQEQKYTKSPFVRIDGKVYGHMTPESLVETLGRISQAKESGDDA